MAISAARRRRAWRGCLCVCSDQGVEEAQQVLRCACILEAAQEGNRIQLVCHLRAGRPMCQEQVAEPLQFS